MARLLLGSLLLAACTTRGSNVDLAKGDASDPVVVSKECRGAPTDPVHLATLAVEGESMLRVKVEHGGGCAAHTFAACWDGTILDSAPPQLHLDIHHDGNGDACDALLSHDILIDVSELPFAVGSAALVPPGGSIRLVGR